MAPPRGSAAYKKKDGTLALSKDGQSVSWTPVAPPGSKPALTLPLPIITSESAYITGFSRTESHKNIRSPTDTSE